MSGWFDHEENPHIGVAHWLQDVGRRRQPARCADLAWAGSAAPGLELGPSPLLGRAAYRSIALAMVAGAYLQYHFIDVLLQIELVNSIIVFVLTGAR